MQSWDPVILSQVLAKMKNDPAYQELLYRCRELEAHYCRVMEQLTPGQQDTIDSYFFACSELNFHIISCAFYCGQASSHRNTPQK